MLRANRDKLEAIVKELLIQETLDEADVYRVAGIARQPGGHEPKPAPVPVHP